VSTALESISPEEKQLAMFAHLGGAVGFIPAVIILVMKPDSAYVKYHATQGIIISVAFGMIVGVTMGVCFLGAPLYWGVLIWKGLAASKGTWEGYPGIAGVGRPPDVQV
jgi:hypothetical protein